MHFRQEADVGGKCFRGVCDVLRFVAAMVQSLLLMHPHYRTALSLVVSSFVSLYGLDLKEQIDIGLANDLIPNFKIGYKDIYLEIK